MTVSAETRFGRWEIIEETEPHIFSSGRRARMFKCRCDCGNIANVFSCNLKSGKTLSCGCLKNEELRKRSLTHGMSKTKIYNIWILMHRRCNNPKIKDYPNYGGRGIRVCDHWNRFENFYADMGEGPDKLTLERIDNNGNYNSENCKWATRKEQRRNSRNTRKIEYQGKTKYLIEWAKELKISYHALYKRLWRGHSVEIAFNM